MASVLNKFIRYALLFSLPIFAACGGGGSGSSSTSSSSSSTSSSGGVTGIKWQPLVGTSATTPNPSFDMYAADLNNDGVDEVIIAGAKSQPTTLANWQNFNMQVFGWNTGTFSNETATWFSGTDNIIIGTGDVSFGDFDQDGYMDFVVSASTDMSDLYAETVVYFNDTGTSFTKSVQAIGTPWTHDIIVADFDGINGLDYMVTDYGPNVSLNLNDGIGTRTFTKHVTNGANNNAGGGSGLSVGDYMGDGAPYEIFVSDSSTSGSDTDDSRMFTWAASAGVLTLTDAGTTIAQSRYTPTQAAAQTHSKAHAIKNSAFDFNNDSKMDVVVYERLDNESTVQFLLNDGIGNFTDVSDTTLVSYNTAAAGANYQAIYKDFNGDGLTDIFNSGTDFVGPHDQTQVLIQSSDGKFVASYANKFTEFWNAIKLLTPSTVEYGQNIQILKGPSNEYYMASNRITIESGIIYATFHTSKIGTKPTTTPQTAAVLLNNVWPYAL